MDFKKIILAVLVSSMILAPATALAIDPSSEICRGSGANSAFCEDKNPSDNPLYGPEGLITNVVELISVLVGIGAVIGIIAGGFRFITSGDNPQEVTKAREIILYALVGVAVAVLAQAIVRLFLYKLS